MAHEYGPRVLLKREKVNEFHLICESVLLIARRRLFGFDAGDFDFSVVLFVAE